MKDDYRSYIQSLPPEEREYILEPNIWHYEDGTGQHAVRIAMPKNGTGWEHVLIYDQSNTRVKAARVPYSQISSYIRRIFQDRDGNFWFGTQTDGVCRYDGKSFVYFGTNEGLSGNQVRGIVQDGTGNLWFATDGGVCRYDGKTFARFTAKDGLSDDGVWSILKDRAGNLWFGTMGEVCRYDGKSFTTFTDKEGLTSNHVQSIFEDKDGKLWFGFSGGVFRFDGKALVNFTRQSANRP